MLSGSAVAREWTTSEPQALYAAADLAADFPGAPPPSLTVRVAQKSAIYGWGVPAQRTLWL